MAYDPGLMGKWFDDPDPVTGWVWMNWGYIKGTDKKIRSVEIYPTKSGGFKVKVADSTKRTTDAEKEFLAKDKKEALKIAKDNMKKVDPPKDLPY
jgi:hypothetical protein